MVLHRLLFSNFPFHFYNLQHFGLGYFLFEKDIPSGVKEFHHYSSYLVLFCNFPIKTTRANAVSI